MQKFSKRYKILIVDDDEMNLGLLEAFLTATNENYQLISAVNGSQALEKIDKYKPDLVLLDIMMPIVNGYEVCSKIKSNPDTRFLPVVLITALNDKENKIRGIEVGADDFLTKPVDRIELLTRVKSLLLTKSLHDDLEHHYKLLKKELAMAKYLQESILPHSVPDIDSLDIAVFYEPSIEIGGDFYYFMEIDDDNLGVFLADICGHGVSAAMKSMVLKDRLFQNRHLWKDPKKLIEALNYGLIDFFSLTDSDSFITALYLIINTKDWELKLVNGGHPEPLLQYDNESRVLNETTTLPVGVFEDIKYEEFSVSLPVGGKVSLFTDGFFEIQISKDQQLSITNFYDKLDQLKDLNANDTINAIIKYIEKVSEEDPTDDRNLIVIKRKE
ncbi:MAG: hypothetical protein APF76_13025 [Desulfitibacter sp. BRH_c19]|nr:MAG: hypothetical protein APF76_13025 [Desulfitibacter sp. BRH_c19]